MNFFRKLLHRRPTTIKAAVGDALGTIPDHIVDQLEDDPYTLKAEKE